MTKEQAENSLLPLRMASLSIRVTTNYISLQQTHVTGVVEQWKEYKKRNIRRKRDALHGRKKWVIKKLELDKVEHVFSAMYLNIAALLMLHDMGISFLRLSLQGCCLRRTIWGDLPKNIQRLHPLQFFPCKPVLLCVAMIHGFLKWKHELGFFLWYELG